MIRPLQCPALLGVALCGAMLAAGCNQPDERFVRKSEQRLARIDGLLTRFSEHEAGGAHRIEVMGQRIERNIDRHEQLLDRDLQNLHRWFDRDVERWPQRKERIGQLVEQSMKGDPARINRTIPYLFY